MPPQIQVSKIAKVVCSLAQTNVRVGLDVSCGCSLYNLWSNRRDECVLIGQMERGDLIGQGRKHEMLACTQGASHCVDSEEFSGRNQSIGCAIAWVTIARDSESNYPFYPVGQFRRICSGYLCVRLAQLFVFSSKPRLCQKRCAILLENPQVLVGLLVHTHSAYLIVQIHHPRRKPRFRCTDQSYVD